MAKLEQGYLPGLVAGILIGAVIFLGVVKIASIW